MISLLNIIGLASLGIVTVCFLLEKRIKSSDKNSAIIKNRVIELLRGKDLMILSMNARKWKCYSSVGGLTYSLEFVYGNKWFGKKVILMFYHNSNSNRIFLHQAKLGMRTIDISFSKHHQPVHPFYNVGRDTLRKTVLELTGLDPQIWP